MKKRKTNKTINIFEGKKYCITTEHLYIRKSAKLRKKENSKQFTTQNMEISRRE